MYGPAEQGTKSKYNAKAYIKVNVLLWMEYSKIQVVLSMLISCSRNIDFIQIFHAKSDVQIHHVSTNDQKQVICTVTVSRNKILFKPSETRLLNETIWPEIWASLFCFVFPWGEVCLVSCPRHLKFYIHA